MKSPPGLWLGLAALAVASFASACSGSSPDAGNSAAETTRPSAVASPSVFTSKKQPYQVALPPGWTVTTVSQEATSDEDEFVPGSTTTAPDQARVTVGFGIPEPDQTVEDRVKFGRSELGAECTSDPGKDVPRSLGREPGIQWSYTCGEEYSLAVNTIHERIGYRLTAHVPVPEKESAEQILATFSGAFQFPN
jgi:hypothetical protein